jgi:hypothetical protein
VLTFPSKLSNRSHSKKKQKTPGPENFLARNGAGSEPVPALVLGALPSTQAVYLEETHQPLCNKLKRLGITCVFVAAKVVEVCAPSACSFSNAAEVRYVFLTEPFATRHVYRPCFTCTTAVTCTSTGNNHTYAQTHCSARLLGPQSPIRHTRTRRLATDRFLSFTTARFPSRSFCWRSARCYASWSTTCTSPRRPVSVARTCPAHRGT